VLHSPNQRVLHPGPEGKFGEGCSSHQNTRQFNRLQRTQISREFLRQSAAQPFKVNGCGDSLHPGRTAFQRLNKQLSQQEYLDITRAQQSRERVVLLLCPR
jgi:hypothetical protein